MSKLAGEGCKIIMPTEEKKPLREIEKSIIKKYRKIIFDAQSIIDKIGDNNEWYFQKKNGFMR